MGPGTVGPQKIKQASYRSAAYGNVLLCKSTQIPHLLTPLSPARSLCFKRAFLSGGDYRAWGLTLRCLLGWWPLWDGGEQGAASLGEGVECIYFFELVAADSSASPFCPPLPSTIARLVDEAPLRAEGPWAMGPGPGWMSERSPCSRTQHDGNRGLCLLWLSPDDTPTGGPRHSQHLPSCACAQD